MSHARQSVRDGAPAQGHGRHARRCRRAVAAFASLAVVLSSACGDDTGTQPDNLRFGQLGEIEVFLDAPLRLGEGRLQQTLTWSSSGRWSIKEVLSYRDLVGDETVTNNPGDPAQFAAAYAALITQVNEVAGLELFIDDLSPTLDPECGATRTRITFTIRDDARDETMAWTRCADGSLANLTQVGAGPDPAAPRVALASRLASDATLGPGFASVYAGSVPFGTLDRGEDSGGSVRTPLALTDQASWQAFWNEHSGGRPVPEVDFSEEMVIVGVVGVRQEAGDSVEVRRVLQVDEGTLIEIFERVPGDFCSPAARTHVPFHVVVAPATPLPIRFGDVRVERVSCGN